MIVRKVASFTPSLTAISAGDTRLSYKELDLLIGGLCEALKKMGVQRGSRVAFLGKATAPTIALFFALFRLGALACPLNFRLPKQALDDCLERLGSPLFLDPEALHFTPSLFEAELDENALATLLFTSGTTGSPKIAAHYLKNHLFSALGSFSEIPLTSKSSWLLTLPLFHVGGLAILFRCFLSGSSVLLGNDLKKASHVSLVPTQLFRYLQEGVSLSHLECILVGGAPISASLLKQARSKGANIYPTYGLTEMSSQVVTCSRLLPYCEMMSGKDNEIFVRGETLFAGYWDKDKGIHLPLNQEGWFATKDLGCFDQKHNFIFLGRKDNLFISGGENIQPEEIERALCALPEIAEAIVVPLPDEEFGHRPMAFIKTEKATFSKLEIQTKLREILPGYKIPMHIFSLPDFPLPLKPSRKELALHAGQLLKKG